MSRARLGNSVDTGVIPPNVAKLLGLAVPAGRWPPPLRLPSQGDGSIVVVYASAEEMAVCREEATGVYRAW